MQVKIENVLDLANRNIKSINVQQQCFTRYLDISFNNIESLDFLKYFIQLQKLRAVSIKCKQIQWLPETLQYIDISGNDIKELDLLNLPNLTKVVCKQSIIRILNFIESSCFQIETNTPFIVLLQNQQRIIKTPLIERNRQLQRIITLSADQFCNCQSVQIISITSQLKIEKVNYINFSVGKVQIDLKKWEQNQYICFVYDNYLSVLSVKEQKFLNNVQIMQLQEQEQLYLGFLEQQYQQLSTIIDDNNNIKIKSSILSNYYVTDEEFQRQIKEQVAQQYNINKNNFNFTNIEVLKFDEEDQTSELKFYFTQNEQIQNIQQQTQLQQLLSDQLNQGVPKQLVQGKILIIQSFDIEGNEHFYCQYIPIATEIQNIQIHQKEDYIYVQNVPTQINYQYIWIKDMQTKEQNKQPWMKIDGSGLYQLQIQQGKQYIGQSNEIIIKNE